MAHLVFTCNSFKFFYWFKFFYYLFKNPKKRFDIFKALISKYFNVSKNSVFLFAAGRMGLYTLLKSLKINSDNEVIVCGYTCVVVTNAIKYTGAKIKYADICYNTLNIDTKNLENIINQNTRVIVVSHNFGITYNDVLQLKVKYPQIIFIEDCAHAFGSIADNKKFCGTLTDASFFSFEFSKPITTGMGGAVIINNKSLLEVFSNEYNQISNMTFGIVFKILITLKLLNFTSYKILSRLKLPFFAFFSKLNLIYKTPYSELNGEMPLHYPVKLSSLLCIFGILQMNDIEKINLRKKEICKQYDIFFKNISNITTYNKTDYVMVRYPILFNENVPLEKVKAIKAELLKNKIYYGEWFNAVVHPKGSYCYGYNSGYCRVGEDISQRIINLPVNIVHRLSDNELNLITSILQKHLS